MIFGNREEQGAIRRHLAERADQQRFMESLRTNPVGTWNLVKTISEWGDAAPTLPSGAIMGLARGSIGPHGPVGESIIRNGVPAMTNYSGRERALREAERRLPSGPSLGGFDETGQGPLVPQEENQGDPIGSFLGGAVGAVGDTLGQGLSAFDTQTKGLGDVAVEQVGRAAAPVQRNVVAPLNRLGYEAQSKASGGSQSPEQVQAMGIGNPQSAKSVSRVAGAAANDALRVVQSAPGLAAAATATAVGKPEGFDFSGPWGSQWHVGSIEDALDPGQLSTVQFARGKSLGEGILPGGPAVEAATLEQRQAASIGGHALTYGRSIASLVGPTDSRLNTIVSGTSDGIVAIAGDPGALLGKAWSGSKAAGATFAASSDEAILNTTHFLLDSADEPQIARIREWAGRKGAFPIIDSAKGGRLPDAVMEDVNFHSRIRDELSSLSAQDLTTAERDTVDLARDYIDEASGDYTIDAPRYGLTADNPDAPRILRELNTIASKHGEADDLVDAVSAKIRSDYGSAREIADLIGKKPRDLLRAMAAPQAGVFAGFRPIIKRESALTHLNGETGRAFVDDLARDQSFTSLRAKFDKTVPVDFIYKLRHADDPTKVRAIYQTELGASVAGPPGYRWMRPPEASVRMWHQMPHGGADLNNANQAVEKMEGLLRVAKVPRAKWDEILEPLANPMLTSGGLADAWLHGALNSIRDYITGVPDDLVRTVAETTDVEELRALLGKQFSEPQLRALADAATDGTARKLLADKIGDMPYDVATKLTRSFRNEYNQESMFFANQIGASPRPAGWVGGMEPVVLEGPFLPSELLQRSVPVPDARALRQATTGWRQQFGVYFDDMRHEMPAQNAIASKPQRAARWALDVESHISSGLTKAFKTVVLSAPRTGLVILADEQTRMAAMGMDSIWTPMSYVGWVIGKEGRKGYADVLGQPWAEQLGDEFSEFSAAVAGSATMGKSPWTPEQHFAAKRVSYSRDQPAYLDAWAGNVGKLHLDPVAREVARAIVDEGYVPTGGAAAGREFPLIHRYTRTNVLTDEGRALVGNDPAEIERLENILDEAWGARLSGAVRQVDDETPEAAGSMLRNVEREMAGTSAETPDVLRSEAQVHMGRLESELRAAGGQAPEGQGVAGLDGVKDWFAQGDGIQYRRNLAAAKVQWAPDLNSQMLTDRTVADTYIDRVRAGIMDMSGGDDRILDAIANGTPFDFQKMHLGVKKSVDRDFFRHLGENMYEIGPNEVSGSISLSTRKQNMLSRATTTWFGIIMDTPAKTLSRSPLFKQAYWPDLQRMIDSGRLSREAQDAAILSAHEMGIPLKASKTAGDLTIETADQIAKARAFATARDYLDYPGEKSNLEDILRNIAPFATAWRDAIVAWGRVVRRNPQSLRRLQQGVQQAPLDDEGNFTIAGIPVTRWATGGMGFALTGKASDVNQVFRGLPGVGWGARLSASFVLPRTSATEAIFDFLNPYGPADVTGGLLESFAPGWVPKLRATGLLSRNGAGYGPTGEERISVENLAIDAMRTMAATGMYDLSDPNVLTKMADKARSQATRLMLLQSLGKAFVPTSLSYSRKVKVKDGSLIEAFLLGEDYRKMLDASEGDSSAATRKFVAKYGEDAIFSSQGKSRSVVFGVPTTVQGEQWVKDHSAFARTYKGVYGYFVPQGGEFDRDVYRRQIEHGDRQPITVEQATALAQARLGQAWYDQQRRRLPASPSKEQREWLAGVKEQIAAQYPGFDTDIPGLAEWPDAEHQIKALLGRGGKPGALDHPDVKNLPLTKTIREYLTIRQQALDAMDHKEFGTGESMARSRAYMFMVGTTLAEENPAFTLIWNNLFQREVEPNEGERGG